MNPADPNTFSSSVSINLANAAAINGDAKSGTLTYAYDALNRLTGSGGSGGTRSYAMTSMATGSTKPIPHVTLSWLPRTK